MAIYRADRIYVPMEDQPHNPDAMSEVEAFVYRTANNNEPVVFNVIEKSRAGTLGVEYTGQMGPEFRVIDGRFRLIDTNNKQVHMVTMSEIEEIRTF